ncbi:MAG: hypothetical protein D3925_15880, partial [Candidatus Electrothrix sp. AR5]|nr:hypothetical protein [Candidatus Electrothrix sp. AR5]
MRRVIPLRAISPPFFDTQPEFDVKLSFLLTINIRYVGGCIPSGYFLPERRTSYNPPFQRRVEDVGTLTFLT